MKIKELWRKIKMKAKEMIDTIHDCVANPVNGICFGAVITFLGLGVMTGNVIRYKMLVA